MSRRFLMAPFVFFAVACASSVRSTPLSTKPSTKVTTLADASTVLCDATVGASVELPKQERQVITLRDEGQGFIDYVGKRPEGADACFVSNDNIAQAIREAKGGEDASVKSSSAEPLYIDVVDRHLRLTSTERVMLKQNGFVVLDRFAYTSYALAYHEIFRQQLPLYVSIDSILHATYRSNATALTQVEKNLIVRDLYQVLIKLSKGAKQGSYSKELRDDVTFYVEGALGLLLENYHSWEDERAYEKPRTKPTPAQIAFGNGQQLQPVKLFGRERIVDATRFEPRGEYAAGNWNTYPADPPSFKTGVGPNNEPAKGPQVSSDQYFRALTWLSRLELNLVSRPCATSAPMGAERTPAYREVRTAMAIAEIAKKSGADTLINKVDELYAGFAGPREDIGVDMLLALMKDAKTSASDPKGPENIVKMIGDRFPRRANSHFRGEECGGIPQVFTMLGIRGVPDVEPLVSLTHAQVPDRKVTNFADIAYALGHDVASEWMLMKDAVYPDKANAARATLFDEANKGKGLYNRWMRATLALANRREGTMPSFTKSDAYGRMRMNSALVSFGQIRHNYVAIAAQGYDSYGCEIPDGYVEPALGALQHLLDYQVAEAKLTDSGSPHVTTLTMLRDIAKTELSGAPLSEPQRRFLAMVAEYLSVEQLAPDSNEPPKYTGWYFDMFGDREKGALKYAGFIGDYFTHTNGAGQVNYLGAEKVRLGVFLVDTNGPPRVMVGPVAKGYFATSSLSEKRFDDAHAEGAKTKTSPWLTYVASGQIVPTSNLFDGGKEACGEERVRLSSWNSQDPDDALVEVTQSSGVKVKVKRSTVRIPTGSYGDAYVRIGPLSYRFRHPAGERFNKLTVQALDHHGNPIGSPLPIVFGQVSELRLPDIETRDAIEGFEYSFIDEHGERRYARREEHKFPWAEGSNPPELEQVRDR